MQSGVVSATAAPKPIASLWHTLLVLAVQVTASARGFMHVGHARAMTNPDRITMYQHTIFLQWIVFAIVIAGVRLHGTSLYAVLGERWRSLQQVLTDAGIGFMLLMASVIVPAILGQRHDRQARWIEHDLAYAMCLPKPRR